MNIDSLIAEAAKPSADAQPVETADANANDTHEAAKEESQGADPAAPNEPVESAKEDVFPKKAVNALSRRDKQIGKLRAELAAERAAKQALEQQFKPAEKPANPGEPKETDFNSYADYMRAVQKYDLQQALAKIEGNNKQTQQTAQEQAWIAQREQHVAATAQAFIKENPDAQATIEEFVDIADEFSPELQRLFLEADNAPLAFYNLAKEGKLEALMSMSPARAAMEIGRAQTQAPSKPKTKAPTPLPASRGSVPAGKSPDQFTPREAQAFLNPKD